MNHRDIITTDALVRREPGLAVSLDARSDTAQARYAVHAHVGEGTGPITLSLYLDGDLIDTQKGTSSVHRFVAPDVPPGRHVVTVRAVDGAGRWGGASTVIESPAPAVH